MRTKIIMVMILPLIGFYFIGTSWGGEAKPAYVGSDACKSCHLKEYKSWKNTKLASAIEVLKPGAAGGIKKKTGFDPDKDYTNEPKCLKCHTTGYGAKGGFKSLAETPQLAGVSCESCHGPGEAYVPIMVKKGRTYEREELIKAGLIIDLKAVCMNCHNPNAPVVGKDYKFSHKERFKGVHIPGQLKYHQKEERELE
jgi:hypothetical protein